MEFLVVFFLLIVGFLFWLYAVHHLMGREDGDFPGANDKLAWAIFLTISGPLGAIVYFTFPQNRHANDPGFAGDSGSPHELECLKCGATIPDGQDECPACGWTYAEQ